MPPPYCYDHPRPSVAVDLVVFCLDGDRLRSLFIRRRSEPFRGWWALPGGFLEMDEPVEVAARRELREETGFDGVGLVEPLGVWCDPGRDPRGRTISLAHVAAIRGPIPAVEGGDDAAEAAWLDPKGVRDLAFDHQSIVRSALEWLGRRVDEGPAGLALLPVEFDADQVRALMRANGRRPQTAPAWLRRQRRAGRIVALDGAEGRFRSVDV